MHCSNKLSLRLMQNQGWINNGNGGKPKVYYVCANMMYCITSKTLARFS